MVKLCVFDLDGTLAQTLESIARPVNMILEKYGLPARPVEAFKYYAGDGLKMALTRALYDAGDTEGVHVEEGLPLCRRWLEGDPYYHVIPYEYIPESLQALKEKGMKLAVFSNKPHASAQKVVASLFGEDVFDYVQGASERIPIKPDPTGLLEILNRFGAEPGECLYFGDTNTDMLTAHAAGVTAVGVSWGFRGRGELQEYGADIIIDDARQIPDLI